MNWVQLKTLVKRWSRKPIRGRISPRPTRPHLEPLEERLAPAVQFFAGPLAAPTTNRADVGLGTLGGFNPIEPAISIDPTDPGGVYVTSHIGLRLSTDVGANFAALDTFANVPTQTGGSGDTDTAFDSQGRLFWVNLVRFPGQRDVVVEEVDPTNGNAVATPVRIPNGGFGDDKPFIGADANPDSPFADNLYVAWSRFGQPVAGEWGVFVSRSTDHGVTWSVPLLLSDFDGPNNAVDNGGDDEGFTWPADVKVAPNGDVYVAYHAQPDINDAELEGGTPANPNGTNGKIFVLRSTDGGLTFGQKTEAFTSGQADVTYNRQSAAGLIPGTDFWAVGAPQPWVLPDPAKPGFVYVVSNDDPNNNPGNGDDGNIVFSRSGNNGLNWVTSTISSGPANSFQLFPTASIDTFGNIVVAWYDNRRGQTNDGPDNMAGNADDNFLLDVFATYSTDGGLTWAPDFMVNDPASPLDPDIGTVTRFNDMGVITTRIGEYFGLEHFGNTAHVAWNGPAPVTGGQTGQQVVFDSFAVNGSLLVTGDDNGPTDDTFTIRRIAGATDFVEVLVNNQRQYAGLLDGLTKVTFQGLTLNDTLIVDSSNGLLTMPQGIRFDGGNGADRLTLTQTGGAAQTTDTLAVGANPGNGRDTIVGPGGTQVVDFENIEPITDNVPAGSFTITSIPGLASVLQGDNAINYEAGQLLPTGGRVTVDNFEPIEFENKTTLTIDAGAGSDEVNIGFLGTPTGLTGLTINAGAPGGSDTVVVTGTLAAEAFEYAPTGGPGNGTLVLPGPDVTFTGTERIVIDGQSTNGDDSLVVRSEMGSDRVVLEPGANVDSGTFHIYATAGTESTPPLEFRALGQDSFIELRSGAGAGTREDTFEYLGTNTRDIFGVTSANGGTITLQYGNIGPRDRKEVAAPGVNNLLLQGLDDDDTFTVAGNHPFAGGVTVNGGNPTASDVLVFNGAGAAVTVDLTASTVGETGFGAVSFAGVENVNITTAGGALTVTGTVGDDDLKVTPTAAGTGTFAATSRGAFVADSPAFSYSGLAAAAFTFNGGTGGFDVLTVLGDDAADAVTSGASTVTRAGGTVTAGTNLDRLDLFTFGGADNINLATFTALSTFVDGGANNDTIVGSPQADVLDGNQGNDLINGGAGADLLLGNDGHDTLDGDAGTDTMNGGLGSDTAVWDPGDGNDVVNGEDGEDTMLFNGNAAAELFTLNPDGNRLELLRSLGNIDMDIGTTERIDLRAGAGADTVTLNDISATAVSLVLADLGAADGDSDDVVVNGTNQADALQITSGSVRINGLSYGITLNNSTTLDRLRVNGLEGDDTLTAVAGVEQMIQMTLDGGVGNDHLIGGGTLIGGDGLDTVNFQVLGAPATIDLDSAAAQAVSSLGTPATLVGPVESFVGSPFRDLILAKPLPGGRSIDGGGGGDRLLINTFGQRADLTDDQIAVQGFNPIVIQRISQVEFTANSAANVDSIVQIREGKRVFDRAKGRIHIKLLFRNFSNHIAVQAPLKVLVAGLPNGVKLINKTANAQKIFDAGSPFKAFSRPDNLFSPGEGFKATLIFEVRRDLIPQIYRGLQRIRFRFSTWAGPGEI